MPRGRLNLHLPETVELLLPPFPNHAKKLVSPYFRHSIIRKFHFDFAIDGQYTPHCSSMQWLQPNSQRGVPVKQFKNVTLDLASSEAATGARWLPDHDENGQSLRESG
jgi:hypothetical protein